MTYTRPTVIVGGSILAVGILATIAVALASRAIARSIENMDYSVLGI